MSAHRKLTAWNFPIGCPNCCLCFAYLTASSRHTWARPTERAATPILPQSSTLRKDFNPAPRSPRRFPAGNLQSQKDSSWVSEMCQPIFLYRGETVKPGVSWCTIMLLISFLPALSPVTAVMMTIFDILVPELVIKHFVPFITQSSPSRTAVVFVAPASEPASGSVRPNAPSIFPCAMGTSHSCFCSSVPFTYTSMAPSDVWAVSYTHLRAHETRHDLVCRLLLEKKKNTNNNINVDRGLAYIYAFLISILIIS